MNKICEFKPGAQIRVYLWKPLIRGAGGLVNSLTSGDQADAASDGSGQGWQGLQAGVHEVYRIRWYYLGGSQSVEPTKPMH